MYSNPNAMRTIERNTCFTNVGLTDGGDVYWEKMYEKLTIPDENVLEWKRTKKINPSHEVKEEIAAHANSRFTTPIEQCPVLDPEWNNPQGVPIDAIIFGGRRDDTVPLVFETFNWQHGTFVGSVMRSQLTAATEGSLGKLLNDPMAMRAFIGYNVKDYFQHWLNVGKSNSSMPKVFHVNWFMKNDKGKFMWPGFGENSRVLEWIFNRVDGKSGAKTTPIGYVPQKEDINLEGINVAGDVMDKLLSVDNKKWLDETEDIKKFYTEMGNKNINNIPKELLNEVDDLVKRLN